MGNNSSSQTAIPLQGTLIPTRTTSRLGQRVLREGVWRRDSQDGDAVHVGTLIAVGNPFTYGAAPSTVWVAWDDGKVEKCRTSRAGHCDLRLYDSGPAGIHFPSITCDACSKADIGGTRWKCGECYDYDLCHACYMADKHSLEHAFLRYDVPGATGLGVQKSCSPALTMNENRSTQYILFLILKHASNLQRPLKRWMLFWTCLVVCTF